MTSVDLLAPVLYYQSPISALQTYNGSTQLYGKPREIFSCRGCNYNLAGMGPASQYQRQKLIQNTVRVYASLYTTNLASLSAYRRPLFQFQLLQQNGAEYLAPPLVNWNQMSDRPVPAVQVGKTSSGSAYRASSTRHTIVRNRPGALTPGGAGVDIKHNSYERYLNRIKGKAPLRRGVIPPNYGEPIPCNPAYPIYGGKTVKTAIVNNCDCPDIGDNMASNARIYESRANYLQELILSVGYKFNVGDFVWANNNYSTPDIATMYKAKILAITEGMATIQFVNDGSIINTPIGTLLIYFECNCQTSLSLNEQILGLEYSTTANEYLNAQSQLFCSLLSTEGASALF